MPPGLQDLEARGLGARLMLTSFKELRVLGLLRCLIQFLGDERSLLTRVHLEDMRGVTLMRHYEVSSTSVYCEMMVVTSPGLFNTLLTQ